MSINVVYDCKTIDYRELRSSACSILSLTSEDVEDRKPMVIYHRRVGEEGRCEVRAARRKRRGRWTASKRAIKREKSPRGASIKPRANRPEEPPTTAPPPL